MGAAGPAVEPREGQGEAELFAEWARRYGRAYGSAAERAARRAVFARSLAFVRAQNLLQSDDVGLEFRDHETRASCVGGASTVDPRPAVHVVGCNDRFFAQTRCGVAVCCGHDR